jgi:rhamnose utilization protein RhaD (predicted bifunctional aldolase and dehydrogenase)
MSLLQLVEMSNRYGSNEEFVLAGGGNTSFKEDGVLYVKGSGAQLSDITAEQFVRMDIGKLHETQGDMMTARLPGEEAKRPSIESVLHAMFPYKFVLHVHPPLINGLTCSVYGKEVCEKLFGDKVVWINLTTPGTFLAQSCNKAFSIYEEKKGKYPQIAILQNHGIFVSADAIDEIDNLMALVVNTLKNSVADKPNFASVSYDKNMVDTITQKLKTLYTSDAGATVLFCTNRQVSELISDEKSFAPLSKPFSPDHIVNCKDEPLYIKEDADVEVEFSAYTEKKGYKPKIVAVQGFGFFALSETPKNAE